ncbi:MAG: MFS transporter, partial [Streptosporangiales bacterium]|nr:MFS transporter [Streptosporangiales bacterium]
MLRRIVRDGGVVADGVPLWRNRPFQLLWAGGAVSQLGTELTRLAMPLLVLAVTRSPGLAGLVAGARALAFIGAQLPAGVWVDWWDRRRTLIAALGIQTANAAGLSALILAGTPPIWALVAFALADGVCAAFAGPARTTAIRGVVPPDQLRGAYAQEESRNHAARLAGPPLGGLLYGLGRAVPFLADALTFLIALLCTILAKVPRRPGTEPDGTATEPDGARHATATAPGHGRSTAREPEPGPGGAARASMRREVAEAFRWLWRRRGLRAIIGVVLALNLLGGAFLLPLIVLVGERGGGALTTGTVLAGIGIGGLAGALLSGRVGGLMPAGRLTLLLAAVLGLANLAMALPLGPWWPMVPLVVVSLITPAFNVVMNVVIVRNVPEAMLGRMDAVFVVAAMGLTPLGPVLGGALADGLGGAGALITLGVLFLLTAATAATSRDLRAFTDGDAPGLDPGAARR